MDKKIEHGGRRLMLEPRLLKWPWGGYHRLESEALRMRLHELWTAYPGIVRARGTAVMSLILISSHNSPLG